ncbi:hypothetical protein DEU38_107162 [Rhodococcus sp. AG1013]|uniref:hypothetical protein n=1 Tax=Rhodococcus sp. AG1013 TaxID=2183996 RepID=UPI000E0ACF27|nr:hypothetical protein [Rhodococcus sp. AG1013]RDI28190.1 hypothetical protein DEU38_107162 [Rhodococcus sp. AG1013]
MRRRILLSGAAIAFVVASVLAVVTVWDTRDADRLDGGGHDDPPTAAYAAPSGVPAEPPIRTPDPARTAGPFVTYNTYPGSAHAQWGKYSIALERDGRYYLLSAGHVGGKVGARLELGWAGPTQAVVSHSTRRWGADFGSVTGGSGLDMSMVDTGPEPVSPVLTLSAALGATPDDVVVVPTGSGTDRVTLPRTARIAAVADDLEPGAVVCQSGAEWFASEYTAAAGNVRCGRLTAPCPTTSDTCSFTGFDAAPAVAPNDSGNPVWVPRADGTVAVLGIVYAAGGCDRTSGTCPTGLFTRVQAYTRREWAADETLPGAPTGEGGRIVMGH